MRDLIIGHLLGAIDGDERERLEQALRDDPELREDFQRLQHSLRVLDPDRSHLPPPPGLCQRTCQMIWAHQEVISVPAARSSRWGLSDLLVAAGVMAAATLLFFPAVHHSRQMAQRAACQNNLRVLGAALIGYSDGHKGYFPVVPVEGRLAAAGIYAPKLLEAGFLDDPRYVFCPASPRATELRRIPTIAELESAAEEQLAGLHQQMGGSYGYSLGHLHNGEYRGTRNQNRTHFALMSDAPCMDDPRSNSPNHGPCGHNVLFEDGRVQFLTTCRLLECDDELFVNADGKVAAGLHEDDSVIAPSPVRPMLSSR